MRPIPMLGVTDPVSSGLHLLAAVASLIGMAYLIAKGRGNRARLISLITFSITLEFLFSMSGVFHLLERGGVAREVFQRLDHCGIWMLIAGTFVPIHVILFRGPKRWAVLLGVWILAITGLVLEVVFFHSVPEALLLSLFLGLGWVGALTGIMLKKIYNDSSLWLLAAGGLLYSVGATVDFLGWPIVINGVIGPHEIFHVFVILGALSHWFFIYRPLA